MERIAVLHRNYFIGILITIVICLLTMRYTPDAALKDYVSFAATLASLILAILAIIQAMYSSSDLSNTIFSLKKSSDSIENNTTSLNNVISELQAKITTLPIEVAIRVNTELSEFSTKQLQANAVTGQTKEEQISSTSHMNDDYFYNYVQLGSVNGLLLLHAIRLSIAKKTPFKFVDILPEEVRSYNLENMHGYLTSHAAAGFVLVSQDGDLFSFERSTINPNLIDTAINFFRTNNNLPALISYFILVKNRIDDFFKS